MKIDDQIKFFGLNNLSIEAAIRKTEKKVGVPFRHVALNEDKDEEFYPQFPEHIRREAEGMRGITRYSTASKRPSDN